MSINAISRGLNFAAYSGLAKLRAGNDFSLDADKTQAKSEPAKMTLEELKSSGKLSRYERHQLNASRVMDFVANTGTVDFNSALYNQTAMDTDKNGSLDMNELQAGLTSGSGEQRNLAANFQSFFAGISQLDGAMGISRMDIAKMSNGSNINVGTMFKASDPVGYQSNQDYAAQIRNSIEQKYGIMLARIA